MSGPTSAKASVIRIAAALIDDGGGQILLVRKKGTAFFMQAGGKIEAGETPITALQRELAEELGLNVEPSASTHLGRFIAKAANEPGHIVEAELFHLRTTAAPMRAAEIEEAMWVDLAEAQGLCLAPLTRDVVLPLAHALWR